MDFSSEYYSKALDLLRKVCVIPAPSHEEDERVAFILDYLKNEGIEGAFADEAKNVIIPYKDDGECKLDVFAAHTDVVFPDKTPLPMKEEGDFLYCPGAGDDTACFVALIMYAIHFIKNRPNTRNGILFVCNSCEEGLGNLDGTRALFKNYGERIETFTSFDASMEKGFVNTAVGSERYVIRVKTPGGHSFANFGNKNAIAILSQIINKLYRQKVASGSCTTYNVGTISGGTSINTIAQAAECTYEYRSVSYESLAKMRKSFEDIISQSRAEGNDVSYECVGMRPCSVDVDNTYLENIAKKLLEKYGLKSKPAIGSTDCNIPLSLGVPAVCFGLIILKGAHTREEYIDLKSYSTGLNLGYEYILEVTQAL